MQKCDFNKIVLQLYRNRTSTCVLSCKFAEYFQNNIYENISGGPLQLDGKKFYPLSIFKLFFTISLFYLVLYLEATSSTSILDRLK